MGDNAQSPRLIETLPRRGYRFIARVEKLNGSPMIESALTLSAAERRSEKTPGDARAQTIKSPAVLIVLLGVIVAAALIAG